MESNWLPKWAKGRIIYQIFPDRFYNGDKANDPPNAEKWEKLPVSRKTLYGGDIRGIIKKIPYLVELGIDAIYLTPIFASPSPHKYDTTDYHQIDPHFGNVKTLKELVRKCHKNIIKVILDGVFGHCGEFFFAFQDILEKGPKSKFADWFYIRSFPIKKLPKPTYEACGIWWLPRLGTENLEVKKYIFSVATYWMEKTKINGWRLDVADEIGHEFWKEFRKLIKKVNPEAIILGEIWHIASPWLQGDEFDSVMNYPFRQLVVDFFAKNKINAKEFDEGLTWIRKAYKKEVNHILYNLIGSHDTPRFLTLCRGNVRKMMLAMIFQMTYPGIPVIYYGDERGMVGGADPDNRRAMDWGELKGQRKELFELYKKLVTLRKSHPALKIGEFFTHFIDRKNNIYSYLRRSEDEEVIVVLNNSGKVRKVKVNTPNVWRGSIVDLLGAGAYRILRGKILVTMKPYSGLVLKTEKLISQCYREVLNCS
ncbi:hypothetical protein LCGC14_1260450 [marine sediment metagenome]|uniref:Glycosyl hydrolase family 13 catalytic domain-containing protein n=1 Tax=marine sediment metagenome TaxID=412755 RepID=A0A0F9L3E4_9ZZZZ